MHPLKELRRLLKETETNHGKVISSSAKEIVVATTRGSATLIKTPGDVTRYQPGDEVVLANHQVVGRRSRSLTVYVV